MSTTTEETCVIDLTKARAVLEEIEALINELDGKDLDERDAVESQSNGQVRKERARKSQALNLLASRFELGASLTRVEYFYARGESDPTQPERNS